MEITLSNFNAALPRVLESIEKCDFLAIDFEFSGLFTDDNHRPKGIEGFQETWNKIRKNSENFALLQFGVCPFRWDRDQLNKKLTAEPFNIYVFKRPFQEKIGDSRLMFQAGSLDFLARCGFDFNKSIKYGVSYLTKTEADAARQRLKEEENKVRELGIYSPNDGEKIKIDNLRFKDGEFVATFFDAVNRLNSREDKGEVLPEEVLPSCSSFCRRIVYQEIKSDFPLIHVGKFPVDNPKSLNQFRNHFRLRLTKCRSTDEVEKIEEQRVLLVTGDNRRSVTEGIGITQIIEKIISSQKRVVGHNCILDIAHIVAKCIGEVNNDVEGFRKQVNAAFPYIVDTKYMLYHHQGLRSKVPQNSLGKAYEITSAHPWFQQYNPEIILPNEFQRYKLSSEHTPEDSLHHEAGYDALMTGILYARIGSALESHYGNTGAGIDIQAYYNKLHVSTVAAFDLSKTNPEPTFKNVVRIFNFPAKTKTWHIKNLFAEYLEPESKGKYINVQWIDDNSAWVFMCTESEATTIVEKARKTKGICKDEFTRKKLSFEDFDIEPYAEYKQPQLCNERSSPPSKKRKRSEPENKPKQEPKPKSKCRIS